MTAFGIYSVAKVAQPVQNLRCSRRQQQWVVDLVPVAEPRPLAAPTLHLPCRRPCFALGVPLPLFLYVPA